MDGKAVIFSAPSGSGKTTIVQEILRRIPELSFSVSATTRSKRPYEIDGHDYYFLTPDEFDAKVMQNEFLEWEQVYSGSKYGTLKAEIERIWGKGQSVIFDVDVVGGVNLKSKLGDGAMAIFVKVADLEVLKTRLVNRQTESDQTLGERLAKAEKELTFESKFDTSIINDDLETAINEAERVVREFLSK